MNFTEMSHKGDPSQLSAIARLAGARDEHRRRGAEAARGTSTEHATASHLSAAAVDVAARETWVGGIERGV